MVDAIIVYIRTKEVVTSEAIMGTPISDGVTVHYCTVRKTAKKERMMPEAYRLALEIITEFADSKGSRLEVCDVSTFGGKLRAWSNGIRAIPALLVCGVRIEGEQFLKLSRDMLESYFEKH